MRAGKTILCCAALAAFASASQVSAQQSSTAQKVSDMVIYSDADYYSAFPSLTVLPGGDILCAFRRAPNRHLLWGAPGYTHTDTNSYLVCVRSKDGGKTWTPNPRLMFAHPMGGSQDPCLKLLSDGTLLCTSYAWAMLPSQGLEKAGDALQHPPFAFLGGYLIRSADGGNTWSDPITPPSLPGEASRDALGRPCPTFNRGEMAQKEDGTLCWAVVRHDDTSPRRSSVHLVTSADGGLTWQYGCEVASDDKVTFNETSLVTTAGGQVVAFMRTDGFDGKGALARSRDGGKSFEKWEDAGFVGHPFQGLRLPDGRILIVYGYRQPPFGIRAKVLDAECTNIATAPEIILRDDGGSSDIGYPWAALLPDGKVLVAYYFNIKDGPRHIAGSILEIPAAGRSR